MKKHIFLAGHPCSGKTTLTKFFKEKGEGAFFDLDELIVQECAVLFPHDIVHNVGEVVKKWGVFFFRALEFLLLKRVLESHRLVCIALGGSTLLEERSALLCKQHGTVVFLETERGEIFQRLKERGRAPSLLPRSKEEWNVEFDWREKVYSPWIDVKWKTVDFNGVVSLFEELYQRVKSAHG